MLLGLSITIIVIKDLVILFGVGLMIIKVIGERDISDLDDKPFVRKRRVRNRTVTLMYCNFFTGFVIPVFFK